MGLKRRARVLLLARPVRAPAWWPREAGKACWVTVLRDSLGWTLGEDASQAMPRSRVAGIREELEEVLGRRFAWRELEV